MENKKIILLGSSNALKPKIIIENLLEGNLLVGIDIIYVSDDSHGICVEYCRRKNIEVRLIDDVKFKTKSSLSTIKDINADTMVSLGWPHKIPRELIGIFRYNPINCHGSILPDYKGSRSYMHYWANCEEYFGASIHYLNEKFDDGNVLVQGKLKMGLKETSSDVHRRTAELCAYLLPNALNLVFSNYEGIRPKGLDRYFLKLTPKEFNRYRKYNKLAIIFGRNKKLTPNKVKL